MKTTHYLYLAAAAMLCLFSCKKEEKKGNYACPSRTVTMYDHYTCINSDNQDTLHYYNVLQKDIDVMVIVQNFDKRELRISLPARCGFTAGGSDSIRSIRTFTCYSF